MADLLASTLMLTHPEDAALALESLDPADIAELFNGVPVRTLAEVLVHLTPGKQADCVKALTESKLIALLPLLPISLCAHLLPKFERQKRKKLTQALPVSVAMALKVAQGYPDDTVGAVMDPFAPTLPLGIRVDEAIKRLRTLAQSVAHQVFVTDIERRLVGRISTSDLLLATRKSRIDELVQREGPVFVDHNQLENLEQHPAWINETLIPVVDRKGLFLGALSQSRLTQSLYGENAQQKVMELPQATKGFIDVADFLWTLLGTVLEISPKRKTASREQPREH